LKRSREKGLNNFLNYEKGLGIIFIKNNNNNTNIRFFPTLVDKNKKCLT